jgi:hypothetical protein
LTWRIALLVLVCAAVIVLAFTQQPIAQPLSYHHFADTRTVFGVPNALNVLSNLPFLFVGLWGLWVTLRRTFDERLEYAILFFGVALTCFGSGYYHLAPDNSRLVWDRLPMTLGFMALFAALIRERVHDAWGRRLLLPLLAIGILSVWYWNFTEQGGAGDLRLYILVQFLPLLCLPVILLLFPAKYDKVSHIWLALVLYGLAKALELLDPQIHAAFRGIVSGHTLKHLSAALGVFWLAKMIAQRTLDSHRTLAATR